MGDNYYYKKEGGEKMAILVDKKGESGNIFAIIGAARVQLKEQDMEKEANEMTERVRWEAKNYEEALEIIQEYVDLDFVDE